MTMHEAARRLGIDAGELLFAKTEPTYNAAPGTTQPVAIGRLDVPSNMKLARTFWGFLPSWQAQPSKSSINMRIESSGNRYWIKAFRKRRCVVPANWWYEWKRAGSVKQPYAIRPCDGDGFFFAGVWSVAKALPEDHALHGARTFAIATKPAQPAIASIHPRMPIALDDAGARHWLDYGKSASELHSIVEHGALQSFDAWPVSSRVNKPENDDVALLDRLSEGRAG